MSSLKKFWLSAWEILEVVLISAVTVFIIRTFFAQPFLVSGASMEPSFSNGNYLIIDEVTYRFREPERGEVVVFRYPKDRSVYFIKRIIGLPGERVAVQSGRVSVFSSEGGSASGGENSKEILKEESTSGAIDVTLGNNQYFVLGDNRYNSFDSRNWGPITKKDIIGVVRLRVFPINDFELVTHKEY